MREDLVKELEIFGFTPNQAKVYLSIIQAGSISVGEIAESSKLYRQDIYKIIPKLEKKGVITRSLGTPIVVKAIPVKKALKTLVSEEKKEALQRIKQMDARLAEISNAVNTMYETETRLEKKEPQFTLLTQENEIINEGDLLYEKAKTECDIVASIELLTIRRSNFHERFLKAINNGAKIRLLLEAPRKDKTIEGIAERVRSDSDNFTAKFVICKSPKPFQVIDREDVWISTSLKSKSGLPCVLWSNGDNIVAIYHEQFERMWNSKKAETMLTSGTGQAKAATAATTT